MSLTVFLVILFAAALHATWNAIVKAGDDTELAVALVMGSAALIAAPILPALPLPARASWPFLLASVLLHFAYVGLVARVYRLADMSQAYPLMRGTAPLIVALASAAGLGAPLSGRGWLGAGLVSAGVLAMARAPGRGEGRAGVALALINALVIAAYTLADAAGVRRSGLPAAYVLWHFFLTGLPVAAFTLATRRRAFVAAVAARWRSGLVGGAGSLASYGLALWAMTHAPVAIVAALRETAILFGTAISGLVLGERVGRARIAAACVIVGGAVVLRLS